MVVAGLPERCICCGAETFERTKVLWPALIDAWDLSPREADLVDLQQGYHCTVCGNSLRTMVLSRAILRAFGAAEPFARFVATADAQRLRVLEVNPAGRLTQFLVRLGRHTLVTYPPVDMTALPYADGAFDLVVHSDTLEHVPDPVAGLRECRRVLAPRGVLAYTVPIVTGRRTRRRNGLAPSYHGRGDQNASDHVVHTEYGDDAWRDMIEAGFDECRMIALAPPIAFALVGIAGERTIRLNGA